jgi:imidazolonepropionase-like amidohydrolase
LNFVSSAYWWQIELVVGRVLMCLAAVFVLAADCETQAVRQQYDLIALAGGTLIDGTGGLPLHDAVVLIKGTKIVSVGHKLKYPKSARVIDVTGKFILPGLIDTHVHYDDWMGELFLAHGVTTVKDLGNDVDWISTVSRQVDEGKVRGPRILYVGDGLDGPPPSEAHHHVAADTPEMAQAAVTLLYGRGASGIKVREKITPELLRAITQKAHQLGITVTGHLRQTDARESALAGIDGLEHASGILQALGRSSRSIEPGQSELKRFVADLKSFSQIDDAKTNDLLLLLVRRKVALIPTMSIFWRMASERRDEFAREDAEYANMKALSYIPQDMRKIWATSAFYNLEPADLVEVKAGYKKLQALLLKYQKAGGKVLAGSDTSISVPGLSLQRELLMLVDSGFTPMEAITSATRLNAEFLGKGNDLGTIAAGKVADLIVVDADPLNEIRNLQKIKLVIKNGRILGTDYHADYPMPTPRPQLHRPGWLERQLQNSQRGKTGSALDGRAVRERRSA